MATLALGATSAGAATSLPSGFQEKTLADTFNASGESAIVDVAWAPDGRMFVADRAGMVFVQNPGALPGDHPLLLDISGHVNNGAGTDRGLLGIAVDKNFATNGYLYLLYTYDKDTTDDAGWQVSTLRRVTVSPDNQVQGGATSPTETTILGDIPSSFGTDPNVGVCGRAVEHQPVHPVRGRVALDRNGARGGRRLAVRRDGRRQRLHDRRPADVQRQQSRDLPRQDHAHRHRRQRAARAPVLPRRQHAHGRVHQDLRGGAAQPVPLHDPAGGRARDRRCGRERMGGVRPGERRRGLRLAVLGGQRPHGLPGRRRPPLRHHRLLPRPDTPSRTRRPSRCSPGPTSHT